MILSKRRIIVIGIIAGIVAIIVIVAIILLSGNANQPTKSIVTQGETVTPDGGGSSGNGSSSQNGGSQTSTSGSNQAPLPAPSTADLSSTIEDSASYLKGSDGQPAFGIVGTVSPLPGWYVVTIDVGKGQKGKVILQQTNDPNNPLTVVAGPGTAFPPDVVTLPDAVRKATL